MVEEADDVKPVRKERPLALKTVVEAPPARVVSAVKVDDALERMPCVNVRPFTSSLSSVVVVVPPMMTVSEVVELVM